VIVRSTTRRGLFPAGPFSDLKDNAMTTCYVKNSKFTPPWGGCAAYQIARRDNGCHIAKLYCRVTSTNRRHFGGGSRWELYTIITDDNACYTFDTQLPDRATEIISCESPRPSWNPPMAIVVGRRDGADMGFYIYHAVQLYNPYTRRYDFKRLQHLTACEITVTPIYPTSSIIDDVIAATEFHQPGGEGSAPETFDGHQRELMLWQARVAWLNAAHPQAVEDEWNSPAESAEDGELGMDRVHVIDSCRKFVNDVQARIGGPWPTDALNEDPCVTEPNAMLT
jgi:hypothetical protein